MDTIEADLQHQREIHTIAKGSLISLVGKTLTKGTRLLTGPVMARLLGLEGYGLFCLADAVVGFVMLILGAPFAMGAVRMVALHDGKAEEYAATGTVVFLGLCGLLGGAIVAAGMMLLAPAVAVGIFHRPELTQVLRIGIWVLPLAWSGFNLASGCVGKRTVLFHETGDLAFRAGGLAGGAMLVLLLARGQGAAVGAYWACAGGLIGGVGVATVGLWGVRRCFPALALKKWRQCDVLTLLGISLPLILVFVSQYGVARVNVFLSGAWLPTDQVAIYGAIVTVTFVDALGLQVIGSILQPSLADLHGRGEHEALQRVFLTATRWVCHLTIPAIVFCAVKASSVLGVFGPSFMVGALALQIAYAGQALNASAGHTRLMLAMAGGQWVLVVIHLVGMAVNLCLSYVLVYVLGYGLVGFAVSSSISVALSTLGPLIAVRRMYGLRTYTIRSARPIVLAILAAPLLFWRLQSVPLDLAVGFVLYFSAYILLNLMMGLEEDDRALLETAKARLTSQ